jgi:hypothetical protein
VGNTIIATNTAPQGPDAWGTFASQGTNLIGVGTGSAGWVAGAPQNNDMVGTAAAPINPGLNPLGNYGGPTQTMTLRANSVARNAGNNLLAVGGLDERGFDRIFGLAIDIGAVEMQAGE